MPPTTQGFVTWHFGGGRETELSHMRLKVSHARTPRHLDSVAAVGWAGGDEIYSCADDHILLNCSFDSTSNYVLYPNYDHCYIRSLKSQATPLKWKAHDGIVLCCDWSKASEYMVTGGEDCKFKGHFRVGVRVREIKEEGFRELSILHICHRHINVL
ncbi:hypothetical protein TELCIR_14526 [Teladorsagia circumcincta]|uniref:WD domain, G-beta repeat protein n=1 Tax=Teladorsagia circumcincta TaxID=45464 RepID=A0A2G9U2C6_TELCI|nr:hypothetical protein TELCIR_14526 [Teladorsagia circumcincta]